MSSSSECDHDLLEEVGEEEKYAEEADECEECEESDDGDVELGELKLLKV